ncbi:ST6GALNAC1 isoform 4, partial [Pongo abelii]
VRYLHFLEGTRDYEWLEALLMNQMAQTPGSFPGSPAHGQVPVAAPRLSPIHEEQVSEV